MKGTKVDDFSTPGAQKIEIVLVVEAEGGIARDCDPADRGDRNEREQAVAFREIDRRGRPGNGFDTPDIDRFDADFAKTVKIRRCCRSLNRRNEAQVALG